MSRTILNLVFAMLLIAGACAAIVAQTAGDPGFFPDRDGRRDEEREAVIKMMAKVRSEQDKKDFANLLKKSDEVDVLADQIGKSAETANRLTETDKTNLETLEKLATKIREELGGSDDGKPLDQSKSTWSELINQLRQTKSQLVSELKRSTRFTVSATAIEASNALIRISRFLRLRK